MRISHLYLSRSKGRGFEQATSIKKIRYDSVKCVNRIMYYSSRDTGYCEYSNKSQNSHQNTSDILNYKQTVFSHH